MQNTMRVYAALLVLGVWGREVLGVWGRDMREPFGRKGLPAADRWRGQDHATAGRMQASRLHQHFFHYETRQAREIPFVSFACFVVASSGLNEERRY